MLECHACLDVVAIADNQIGVAEMMTAVRRTGGTIALLDSIADDDDVDDEDDHHHQQQQQQLKVLDDDDDDGVMGRGESVGQNRSPSSKRRNDSASLRRVQEVIHRVFSWVSHHDDDDDDLEEEAAEGDGDGDGDVHLVRAWRRSGLGHVGYRVKVEVITPRGVIVTGILGPEAGIILATIIAPVSMPVLPVPVPVPVPVLTAPLILLLLLLLPVVAVLVCWMSSIRRGARPVT